MTRHAVPEPAQVAEPKPAEDIIARAIVLVAYVKERALTRTDQASAHVLVRRDLLLKLAAAVDVAYPGEVARLRQVIDAPTEAGPS